MVGIVVRMVVQSTGLVLPLVLDCNYRPRQNCDDLVVSNRHIEPPEIESCNEFAQGRVFREASAAHVDILNVEALIRSALPWQVAT